MSISNGTKKLINTKFISNIGEYNAKYNDKKYYIRCPREQAQ